MASLLIWCNGRRFVSCNKVTTSAIRLSISVLSLSLVFGCSETPQPTVSDTSRPVKIFTVGGSELSQTRTLPARIDASQRADLAFRVPGHLQQILVREGDVVTAGQVLARLDPADFELAVENRQAAYDNADRNFERAKGLISSGNISQLDYDRMEAEYRSTSAALNQALRELEYTELKAAFAGIVARRMVENFEEVQAQQPLFDLQNIDILDVIVDVPESMVRASSHHDGLNRDAADGLAREGINAQVCFDDFPDRKYPLAIKEVSTTADPQTQTFAVTFSMIAPEKMVVLPGMSGQVELTFPRALADDTNARWVPVSAVQADSELTARVWLLERDTMTVRSQAVEIGRISGRLIEVVSGLSGGEEIVAIGAPYLAEEMRVTQMDAGEQAVPRDIDR